MQDFVLLMQEALATGANGATIAIAWFLFKVERRVHILEIMQGIRRADVKKRQGDQ
ncbi:hypothetical protein [Arsukibacterium sp.]|uniref:hypothetical protein n=1 Tax=Arsukibacterium sp. TaxID=1977258 RepID=UPI002FD92C3C